jgi:hypothetical protein
MTGRSLDRTGLNPVNVRPEIADELANSDLSGAGEEWLVSSRSKCTESR